MNRTELANAISIKLDIAHTDALKFLDTFEDVIRTTLSEGGDISLLGFGRFYRKRHGARLGRHPQTGQPITLSARYVPVFSPGKTLKETLNQAGQC